jgi:large subunit ribosomal protein L25
MVPAVVYGLERPSFLVAVDQRRVDELLRLGSGRNTILTLKLAGQDRSRAAMIKDLQRDPVNESVVHIDFVRIDLDKPVQVTVPVNLVGTAEGVKNEGGIMDFIHRDIRVECLPSDIPEHLDVDVEALHVGQHVSAVDLQVGERVTILDDPNTIIAVVMAKRAEEETVAEAEAEAEAPVAEGEAEPEVIKKGKDAEGEEGADKAGE